MLKDNESISRCYTPEKALELLQEGTVLQTNRSQRPKPTGRTNKHRAVLLLQF